MTSNSVTRVCSWPHCPSSVAVQRLTGATMVCNVPSSDSRRCVALEAILFHAYRDLWRPEASSGPVRLVLTLGRRVVVSEFRLPSILQPHQRGTHHWFRHRPPPLKPDASCLLCCGNCLSPWRTADTPATVPHFTFTGQRQPPTRSRSARSAHSPARCASTSHTAYGTVLRLSDLS